MIRAPSELFVSLVEDLHRCFAVTIDTLGNEGYPAFFDGLVKFDGNRRPEIGDISITKASQITVFQTAPGPILHRLPPSET
jgi:hypothetical protein